MVPKKIHSVHQRRSGLSYRHQKEEEKEETHSGSCHQKEEEKEETHSGSSDKHQSWNQIFVEQSDDNFSGTKTEDMAASIPKYPNWSSQELEKLFVACLRLDLQNELSIAKLFELKTSIREQISCPEEISYMLNIIQCQCRTGTYQVKEVGQHEWEKIFKEHRRLLENTEMHSKRKFSTEDDEELETSNKRVSVGGRSSSVHFPSHCCNSTKHGDLLVECDKILEILQDTNLITEEMRESAFVHFRSNKDVANMQVFIGRKVDSRVRYIESYCVPKT